MQLSINRETAHRLCGTPTPHPMHNLAGSSDVLGDHLMAHTTNPCPPADQGTTLRVARWGIEWGESIPIKGDGT